LTQKIEQLTPTGSDLLRQHLPYGRGLMSSSVVVSDLSFTIFLRSYSFLNSTPSNTQIAAFGCFWFSATTHMCNRYM